MPAGRAARGMCNRIAATTARGMCFILKNKAMGWPKPHQEGHVMHQSQSCVRPGERDGKEPQQQAKSKDRAKQKREKEHT